MISMYYEIYKKVGIKKILFILRVIHVAELYEQSHISRKFSVENSHSTIKNYVLELKWKTKAFSF